MIYSIHTNHNNHSIWQRSYTIRHIHTFVTYSSTCRENQPCTYTNTLQTLHPGEITGTWMYKSTNIQHDSSYDWKCLSTVFTYRGWERETRCNLGPSEYETEQGTRSVSGDYSCQNVSDESSRTPNILPVSLKSLSSCLGLFAATPLTLSTKTLPSSSLHFLSTGTISLVSSKIKLLAVNNKSNASSLSLSLSLSLSHSLFLSLSFSLSLSCIRLCLFLSLDLNDKVISVKHYISLISLQAILLLLQKAVEKIKHYSKKWHYADERLCNFMSKKKTFLFKDKTKIPYEKVTLVILSWMWKFRYQDRKCTVWTIWYAFRGCDMQHIGEHKLNAWFDL